MWDWVDPKSCFLLHLFKKKQIKKMNFLFLINKRQFQPRVFLTIIGRFPFQQQLLPGVIPDYRFVATVENFIRKKRLL
jgi:hypothetical protein